MPPETRAFVLVELVAVLILAGMVAALLLVCSESSRRLARLGEDIAHLRQIGAATGQYAADNGDLFWSFSWQHGQTYQTQYPDLNNAFDDLTAAANQAVYLMRTRGNLPNMPVVISWFPHALYSHMVLADYVNGVLPWLQAVSAGDEHRRRWEQDRVGFLQNSFAPYQPNASNPMNWRWLFSASFMLPLGFVDRSPVGSRIQQVGNPYNQYNTWPATVLGAQLTTSMTYPAQKVVVHDQNAWHFGPRQAYCTHDEARLPLLMGDASVDVRAASDANPGWMPNLPQSLQPTQMLYASTPSWQPAPLDPSGTDIVVGRFRWTRAGVGGRDFGGPEVPGL